MTDYIFKKEKESDTCINIYVDPAQPYLADHDVGVPLLGTVMSLEAIAEAVWELTGKKVTKICRLESGVDCLIPTPQQLQVEIFQKEENLLTCRFTQNGDLLFACDACVEQEKTKMRNAVASDFQVDQLCQAKKEDVYKVLFHGPAFQVVDSVWFDGRDMFGKGHIPMPSLRKEPVVELLPIRVIELCLQTSGMLDIALDGMMSVPKGIRSVSLYTHSMTESVYTKAVKTELGNNILAYNRQGELLVAIEGYETKEIPYSERQCPVEMQELHARFIRRK